LRGMGGREKKERRLGGWRGKEICEWRKVERKPTRCYLVLGGFRRRMRRSGKGKGQWGKGEEWGKYGKMGVGSRCGCNGGKVVQGKVRRGDGKGGMDEGAEA